jgi:hypothetical protein
VLEDLVKQGASWSTDINQFGASDVFSGNHYYLMGGRPDVLVPYPTFLLAEGQTERGIPRALAS